MKVSVVIPTFNGAAYVTEALASVSAQTHRDLEILVLDDCSEDGTYEVARRWDDPRLHLSRNSQRLGLAANWNRGIELSKGEFVLILHQDDRLAPEMVETQVRQLEQSPRAGYAYSAYRQINEHGEPIQTVKPFAEDHVWPGAKEFEHHLRWNYVQCPTVIVRRTCYQSSGMFDPDLLYALDWEMWMRIETHGYDVSYCTDVLADWRLHPKSRTRVLAKQGSLQIEDELKALGLVFDKLPPEAAPLRTRRNRSYYELIKQSLLRGIMSATQGDREAARQQFEAAALAYRKAGDLRFFPFLIATTIRHFRRQFTPSKVD